MELRFWKNWEMFKQKDDESPPDNKKDRSSKGEIIETEDYSKSYRQRNKILSYEEMQEFYERNEWVRSCVDQIVATAVKVKPYVAPIEDYEDGKVPKDTQEHIKEVEALLANPNDKDESFNTIRRKILTDILKFDAGAMEIVFDNHGIPVELFDLPGRQIRLNTDEHGNFKDEEKAYVQIPSKGFGKKDDNVYFSMKEVIYFVANPQSGSLYGLSPLESLVNSVEADLNASEYNASFFKNNAEPSGIIQVTGLNKTALKRFKTYWKQQFKGPNKAHRLLVANAKSIDFKKISESAKDMQFMEYQQWLLQKILTVYKVKPFVLGIIDETTGKLNSAEQWTAFKQQAIDPLLSLESYLYTTKLIKAGFEFDDIEIRFEETDIKDEEQISKISETLVKNAIMTINEVRREYYGMDPVAWGDEPYLPGKTPLISESKEEQKSVSEPLGELKAGTPTQETGQDISRISDKIRDILNNRTE